MLHKKVLGLYEKILTDFYKAKEDLEINGRRFSSTLLLELIGFINRANSIIFGDYGQGKTTSAEVVGSIMAGMPYPVVVSSEVRGSPEITEEKLLGRVHLGQLQQGIELVLWSSFVKSPIHIVDEITRIPEIKQSMILEGIRTGRWLYLGQLLETGRTPLYATANFEDLTGGSFELIPALMDRFALGLDSAYPGVRKSLQLAFEEELDAKVERAGLAERTDEALELLRSEYDREALREFTEDFKRHLEEHGFTPLYADELDQARREIQLIPLSQQAERFMGFTISILNFCPRTEQKRHAGFGENGSAQGCCSQDCPFYDTACSRVVDGGSRRQERDIIQTARALAWILGEDRVGVEHLRAVAPFNLWHRRAFARDYLSKLAGQKRVYPLKLEAAHRFVEEIYEEFEERQDLTEYIYENESKLRGQDSVSIWKQTDVDPGKLHPHYRDLLSGEA